MIVTLNPSVGGISLLLRLSQLVFSKSSLLTRGKTYNLRSSHTFILTISRIVWGIYLKNIIGGLTEPKIWPDHIEIGLGHFFFPCLHAFLLDICSIFILHYTDRHPAHSQGFSNFPRLWLAMAVPLAPTSADLFIQILSCLPDTLIVSFQISRSKNLTSQAWGWSCIVVPGLQCCPFQRLQKGLVVQEEGMGSESVTWSTSLRIYKAQLSVW